MGSGRPRDCSMRVCTPRRRDAATIFMAFVIFAMFPTDFMRCFTVDGNAEEQTQRVTHTLLAIDSSVAATMPQQAGARTDLTRHLSRPERL